MKPNEIAIIIAELVAIILGLFVSYQIVRIIFGGSWTTEKTILTIVTIIAAGMFTTIGFLIKLAKDSGRLTSDVGHITDDLKELKTDFKKHAEKLNSLTTKFEVHLEQHRKH